YSGIMKGGTTHRMLSCTVTFLERWSDLTMHEIHVCRHCTNRLWRQKHRPPVILYACGAAVSALVALLGLLLLQDVAQIVVAALAATAAFALGGLLIYQYQFNLIRKPTHSELEPLVMKEAMDSLPDNDHTYMTTEQYLERHQKGIIE